MNNDNSLNGLKSILSAYDVLDEQLKQLEKKKSELREEVANEMHKLRLNKVVIDGNLDTSWHCEYSIRTTRNTDYQRLMEIVGPENYHEIVSSTDSTSLYIRKKKKKKKLDLTEKAPNAVDKNNGLLPPVGSIA